MLLLALVLTACGGDDDEAEPTTTLVDPAATTAVTEDAAIATPDDDLATPATIATPEVSGSPVATPIVAGTPVLAASPAAGATPDSGMAVPVGLSDDESDDGAGMQTLSGTVSLPGTINDRFVIADDGCVGLGRYAGVQAGQQVVVRDEAGSIVGVTELEPTGSAVVCGWTFEVEVPESSYFAVSIPMVSERVFSEDEVANSEGQIELLLP